MIKRSDTPAALIVLPSPASQFHRELIIGLAVRHRLPAIYPYRFHAASGGLFSYGLISPTSIIALHRMSIGCSVGQANFLFQPPTKYELIINSRTATALGLTFPNALLVSADEVIE